MWILIKPWLRYAAQSSFLDKMSLEIFTQKHLANWNRALIISTNILKTLCVREAQYTTHCILWKVQISSFFGITQSGQIDIVRDKISKFTIYHSLFEDWIWSQFKLVLIPFRVCIYNCDINENSGPIHWPNTRCFFYVCSF